MSTAVKKVGERNRIYAIDVLRGVAMALIIFAHCRPLINEVAVSKVSWTILFYCTNISTVTFALINGTMLTYFFMRGKSWNAVYTKFAKRALLLLACHPLIKIISFPAKIDEGNFWHYFVVDFPITDTIALCLLLTPLLNKFIPPGKRVLVITTMLIISPLVVGLVQTDSKPLQIVIQFLFGTLSWNKQEIIFPFPLVPWLAIDFCGSFIGKKLAKTKAGDITEIDFIRYLRGQGNKLFVLSMALIGIYEVSKAVISFDQFPELKEALSPSKTTSLLPSYIAVVCYALAYLFIKLDTKRRLTKLAWIPSVFGRTSLFSYNVQFIIAMSIPTLLGFKYTLLVPGFFLAFAILVTGCWICSFAYGKTRGWVKPFESSRLTQKLSAEEVNLLSGMPT